MPKGGRKQLSAQTQLRILNSPAFQDVLAEHIKQVDADNLLPLLKALVTIMRLCNKHSEVGIKAVEALFTKIKSFERSVLNDVLLSHRALDNGMLKTDARKLLTKHPYIVKRTNAEPDPHTYEPDFYQSLMRKLFPSSSSHAQTLFVEMIKCTDVEPSFYRGLYQMAPTLAGPLFMKNGRWLSAKQKYINILLYCQKWAVRQMLTLLSNELAALEVDVAIEVAAEVSTACDPVQQPETTQSRVVEKGLEKELSRAKCRVYASFAARREGNNQHGNVVEGGATPNGQRCSQEVDNPEAALRTRTVVMSQ